MIYIEPGDTFPFELSAPGTALADWRFRIEDDDDVVVEPETAAGITEFAADNYRKKQAVPTTEDRYTAIWRNVSTGVEATEQFEVTSTLPTGSGVGGPGEVYATSGDLAAYNEEQGSPYTLPSVGTERTRLIEASQNDLDAILGDYDLIESGAAAGQKLDPDDLDYLEARAIRRATCAQALYRIEQGPEFFLHPKLRQTSGPEFGTEGTMPHVGPMAMRELSGSGLLRNVTSFSNRGRRPSWAGFSHNLG